jgi:xylulokinase
MPPSPKQAAEVGPITVGIDIGTTSVKALAVAEGGEVVARSRVPHRIIHQSADHLEHDARAAWRRGPTRALAALRQAVADSVAGRVEVAGICVAGMVPSLTAVDRRGIPRTPGLLYGDVRGRAAQAAQAERAEQGEAGEAGEMPDAEGFLAWTAAEMPDAHGYWPAQAVATHAVAGQAVIDTAVTSSLGGLYRSGRWNEELLARMGVDPARLPQVAFTGQHAGELRTRRPSADAAAHGAAGGGGRPPLWDDSGAAVAGGTIDALCDQIVAGADRVGDVLVILGATLIVWVVTDDWVEAPGLWTVPHTTAGRVLIGGPSNAGALFVDWAQALVRHARGRPAGDDGRSGDPARVPLWLPYLRGERVPFHDASLRAGLFDLDITDTPDGVARAAYEASGFVVRSMVERSGIAARRIVASGGGTRVAAWTAGLADATGLPVDTVAVPEGAALGAAFLARMAAGLEPSLDGSSAWARPGARVEPDPRWQVAAARRFERFRALGEGP